MIETWGDDPPEKPEVDPDPFQQSVEAACSHNWDGDCAFFLPEWLDPETRQPCRLCPQWATGKNEWKERLKVPYERGVADFWDLIRLNPSLAKMYGLKPLKKAEGF